MAKGKSTSVLSVDRTIRKSRVGKETKFGPQKGSRTPGNHSNILKVR